MKKYLIIIVLALFSFGLKSQNLPYQVEIDYKAFVGEEKKEGYKEAKDKLKEADGNYELDNRAAYTKALDLYLVAYKFNSNNAELNFKIGYCYLNTLYKSNALQYIEKAYELNKKVSPAINYYYGMALQYNYLFDMAAKEYQTFRATAPSDLLMSMGAGANKKIEECKNGADFMENVRDVMIQNLGIINTEYAEYAPLISADESILLFTSRRIGSSSNEIWDFDGQYFEDIYMATNENGMWSKPINIGAPLNTKEHDATIGLSGDGQSMFLYRDLDIYTSELEGEVWSKPKKLPKTINTDNFQENSAAYSPDGKTLYFVRGKTNNPTTSNGDLYKSTLFNGKWSEGVPIKELNTKYDEDGVFMHPDGKTIYYSSKGFNSIGGYDIFKAELQDDGKFSTPENMGIPVNSPDDDVYFVLAADGRTGYYSSVKPDGKGATDIYKMIFLKLDKPLTINTEDNLIACLTNPTSEISNPEILELKKIYLTIVKGTITDEITHEPVKASIEITDNSTGKEVMQFYSNQKTGKYLISLASGKNYGMAVRADGYLFHSENFDIPKAEGYQEIIKDVELKSMKKGSIVILRNVFFDTDKYDLRPESNTELNRLVKVLTENPAMRIEISGHTDSRASDAHNLTLSKNRANAVVNYLIANGIDKNRLEFRGAGEHEPIDSNETVPGRQNNRRVQFMVL